MNATTAVQRRPRSRGKLPGLMAGTALAMCLVVGPAALTMASAAECVPNEKDGSCLPIAPESARVDLAQPSFSEPQTITNPLLPASELDSILLLGQVDGKPFRTEVTLLPEPKTINWNGQAIEARVSQYVAFLDGRLHEVALDWYAQADDGAVWYLGEDVFNYEEGAVTDTHGTWKAGKDGPGAMIMPADPQAGDVYRSENIPGLIFEEITVKTIDQTVDGPHGPVDGAIVVTELHQDGTTEEKTFAPGYGEFFTGGGGDVEALALAVPTDGIPGFPTEDLMALASGADTLRTPIGPDWATAMTTLGTMTAAWDAYHASGTPPLIDSAMRDTLAALAAAIDARDEAATNQAAIDVAKSALDLQLRQRPVAEIDRARFDIWVTQLLIDTAASDAGAVRGDVATLGWIWDRIAHTYAPAAASNVDAELTKLRAATEAGEFSTVTDAAIALRGLLGGTELPIS